MKQNIIKMIKRNQNSFWNPQYFNSLYKFHNYNMENYFLENMFHKYDPLTKINSPVAKLLMINIPFLFCSYIKYLNKNILRIIQKKKKTVFEYWM
jgi:hypothetical protein